MKKYKTMMIISVLMFYPCMLFMVFSSLGYYPNAEEYYKEISNYETFQAEIIEIIDSNNALVFILNHENKNFDEQFVIKGENYSIVMNNNILEFIKVNDVVEVTSAPRIHESMLEYPIVGIKYNEQVLLNIDEGITNLVQYYEDWNRPRKPLVILSIVLSLLCFTFIIVSMVLYYINYKKEQKEIKQMKIDFESLKIENELLKKENMLLKEQLKN